MQHQRQRDGSRVQHVTEFRGGRGQRDADCNRGDTQRRAARPGPPENELVGASVASLPFGMVACLFGAAIDKKRARQWLACAVLLAAVVFPAACGGGGSIKRVAQSYIVTVTGVSGTITHEVQVNVTVGP